MTGYSVRFTAKRETKCTDGEQQWISQYASGGYFTVKAKSRIPELPEPHKKKKNGGCDGHHEKQGTEIVTPYPTADLPILGDGDQKGHSQKDVEDTCYVKKTSVTARKQSGKLSGAQQGLWFEFPTLSWIIIFITIIVVVIWNCTVELNFHLIFSNIQQKIRLLFTKSG